MIRQIQHSKTVTASGPLHELVALTTGHIKIHGWNHCKDGMKILLKHVDIMLIGYTHKMEQK